MKYVTFRTACALGLATLLAACGAGTTADLPVQTAGLVQAGNDTAQPIVTAATATMPAPDCAADGCQSLRIIDANAESYRYNTARHAAEVPAQS